MLIAAEIIGRVGGQNHARLGPWTDTEPHYHDSIIFVMPLVGIAVALLWASVRAPKRIGRPGDVACLTP